MTPPAARKAVAMLLGLIVVLSILWLLGIVTSYTLGGFIHVLIVVALVVFVLRLVRSPRAAR